jgi:hypothetical protein
MAGRALARAGLEVIPCVAKHRSGACRGACWRSEMVQLCAECQSLESLPPKALQLPAVQPRWSHQCRCSHSQAQWRESSKQRLSARDCPSNRHGWLRQVAHTWTAPNHRSSIRTPLEARPVTPDRGPIAWSRLSFQRWQLPQRMQVQPSAQLRVCRHTCLYTLPAGRSCPRGAVAGPTVTAGPDPV